MSRATAGRQHRAALAVELLAKENPCNRSFEGVTSAVRVAPEPPQFNQPDTEPSMPASITCPECGSPLPFAGRVPGGLVIGLVLGGAALLLLAGGDRNAAAAEKRAPK